MAVNPEIDLAKGFRRMTVDDISAVMEIETQVYTHPWTKGIFHDCLRVGYNCWVYVEQNQLLAYGLVTVAANEAHILNLCVNPAFQGQGLGKRMLYKLIHLAEERQADSIFLEVRITNDIAQKLYEQEGFNRIGRRKEYYPSNDGREDAYVFARALNVEQTLLNGVDNESRGRTAASNPHEAKQNTSQADSGDSTHLLGSDSRNRQK